MAIGQQDRSFAASPGKTEKRKCSNKKRTRIINDLVIVLYANDNIKVPYESTVLPSRGPAIFFGCDLKTIINVVGRTFLLG